MPDAIAPDGSEIYFRSVEGQRASLVEVVLPPGGVSRPVRHRTVEETWYFLQGAGQVWLQPPRAAKGATRGVAQGDVVLIPTGWAFQFRTTGDVALRFLCFTVPAWPGDGEAIAVDAGGLGPPTV